MHENDDDILDDSRTRARRFHEALKRKRLKQRRLLKQEAMAQGGPDDMHDDPARENKILFNATDDIIREPDAIQGARELELRSRVEHEQIGHDRDLEAVDDVAKLEEQDFDVV